MSKWRDEWNGMPEYIQNENKPFSTITVRFRSEADLMAFSALIGQKLTPKTKSLWIPELEKRQRGVWIKDET
jgi:hypothetical protein